MSSSQSSSKQPAGTYVIVYGPGFEVESATPGIGAFFAAWPGLAGASGLEIPRGITDLVRTLAGGSDRVALIERNLAVRVESLRGVDGERFVATFERFAIRDPVRAASARFSLTDREAQVLDLLLHGMRAADIARTLEISELTVGDYFKRLRAKTGARTQSGMLAMLLGFEERERSDSEDAS